MARAISKCPNCGEPVTPFAAGCAICGFDLESARAARARRSAPVGRHVTMPRLGDDALRIAIAVLVTIAAPFFGVLLTGFFAWQLHQDGRAGMRNAMLAIVALGLLSLAEPFWFWRLLGAG